MSESEIASLESHEEVELSKSRMSFGEHLEELRSRMLRGLFIVLAGLVACFVFHQEILAIIVQPYRDAMIEIQQDPTLKVVGVAQGVFVSMKVSFIAGLILTGPFWIYQIWAFIAAGLYRKEKRLIYRYAPLCVGLFFTGVAFGYYLLLPLGLGYLITFTDPDLVQSWIGLSEYLGFFALLTIALGVSFQLPVVMLGLARAGMITVGAFRRKRRWVILGIFIVAALITPPDPITQSLLAIPLCGLYELGIILAWAGQGARREPLDRAVLKRRAWKTAAFLALVAVLWRPIQSWRHARAAEEAMVADKEGGLELSAMFAEKELFGRVPALTFLLEKETGSELWLVGDAEAAIIAEVRFLRDRTLLTDRSERGVDLIHNQAGIVRVQVRRPETVPWSRILPPLEEAVRDGSDEVRAKLLPVVRRLTGLSLEGDADRAAAALLELGRSRADEAFRQ